MAKITHRAAPASQNHVIQRWEVADAGSRATIVPTPADVGGVARQADDGSLWILTNYAPVTWRRVDPDPAEFSGPAQAAQAAAEAAAAAAVGSTKIYASTAAAQADGALANGSFYSVPVSGTNDAFIFYRKDSGAGSTEMTRYPSTGLVATVQRNAPNLLGALFRSGSGAVASLRAKGREAFTVVRSTTGEVWSGGARVSCGANVARLSDDPWGLLVEPARTQYVGAPTAPVNETVTLTTGVHAVQIEGSGSLTITNGTGTATGSPLTFTGRTPGTFTVTGAGTFTLAYTGTVTFAQLEKNPYPTSRLTTTGAAAADKVSIPNPLVGRTGAWHIDVVAELVGRPWTAGDARTIWVLGDWPYSHANVASLVSTGDSVYLDVFDGSNVQKRITLGTGINLGSSQRHRFTAGADEAGNLFLLVDGEASGYTTAGAGTGIIAAQPSTIYLGSDATLQTNWLGGTLRDFEVKAGEPDIIDVQRPRYLMGGDSIYMPSGLRDAIKAALGPNIVPHIDCVACGGDTMGSAFPWVADKHFYFSGGPYGPTGKWVEMTRGVPLSDYDAWILEYGRNEPALAGQSAAVYQEAYDKLINQAVKLGVKRILAGTPPPLAAADLLSWATDSYNTGGYRTNLAGLWTKYGIRGIDTYSAFLDEVATGRKSIADLMSDNAHANTAAGWADIARRIAIALREKLRPINRRSGVTQVVPIVPGTVRTYWMGSQVTGDWARQYLDTDTHIGLNASNPWIQLMPRLIGMRDQSIRATTVGSRLIWPAGKARQIWLHVVLETGGGTIDMYVDRGAGGQVLRSLGTNGGERLFSVLMAENLNTSDHTPEVQITGAGPVNILGVTYVGND